MVHFLLRPNFRSVNRVIQYLRIMISYPETEVDTVSVRNFCDKPSAQFQIIYGNVI